MTEASMPVLYVLPPSHFCERARWALQHAGVPFREKRLAAGLHVYFVRRIAPARSVPVLKVGEAVIQGSGAILDWIELSGGEPEIETRLEARLGRLLPRYIYASALSSRGAAIRGWLFDGVPLWQKAIGTLAWPAIRAAIIRVMDARPELAPRIADKIARELDWFEERLGGRRHLVGQTFGRADLTAASLISLMIGSPGMASRNWLRDDLFAHFKDRPSLAWARRIYADHRCSLASANTEVHLTPPAARSG